jgi:hypothetical protein
MRIRGLVLVDGHASVSVSIMAEVRRAVVLSKVDVVDVRFCRLENVSV